jgi:predicted methyltransferase
MKHVAFALSWPLCVVIAGPVLALAGASFGCSSAPPAAARDATSAALPAEGDPAAAPTPSDDHGESAQRATSMLDFFAIGRAERIADLGSGAGYSLTPMLNAVGPYGIVYTRHDPRTRSDLPRTSSSAPPEERLPANVIQMPTSLAAPFLPVARNLDRVFFLFAYHDLVAQKDDRRAFNAAVFQALKAGGLYFIAEHAAPPGSGLAAARESNRFEERIVRADVVAAGFRFVESAEFLPSTASEPRAPGDGGPAETSQYLLKFQKPAQ